jgi:hypothetical protein
VLQAGGGNSGSQLHLGGLNHTIAVAGASNPHRSVALWGHVASPCLGKDEAHSASITTKFVFTLYGIRETFWLFIVGALWGADRRMQGVRTRYDSMIRKTQHHKWEDDFAINCIMDADA